MTGTAEAIGTMDYSVPDSDLHSEIRGYERYGVFLSDADRADMVAQIQGDRAAFIAKASKHASIFMVHWPEARRVVPVIYRSGKIKTILPREGLAVRNAFVEDKFGRMAEAGRAAMAERAPQAPGLAEIVP